jgi:hypothetical protein
MLFYIIDSSCARVALSSVFWAHWRAKIEALRNFFELYFWYTNRSSKSVAAMAERRKDVGVAS